MTGHERIKRQLTDLAAGELGPLAAWGTRKHLKSCAECQAEWERVQTLWQDLRGLSEAIPPMAPRYTNTEPETTEGEGFYRFLLERMPLRRIVVLPALALCAVAVTALLPQTRPTVQNLSFMVFGSPNSIALDTATLPPEDSVEAQVGVALSSLQEERYDTLRKRFLRNLASNAPNNPVVWGALFNDKLSETRRFGIPGVPGESKEPWIPPPSGPWAKNPNTDTLAAKAFLEDARKAERADPDNAFFTVMRSFALLSLQRAQPGIDAFLEASRKPYFKDYQEELIQAVWIADAIRQQDFSSLTRLHAQSAAPAYYMSILRAVGRAIYSRAMGLEVEGKRAEAFQLRRAMLDLAEKMQSSNASTAQYLTGTAIASMSTARPGGQKMEQWPQNTSPESGNYSANAADAYYARRGQEFSNWYNTPEAARLADRASKMARNAPRLQQIFTSLEERYLGGVPYLREYIAASAVSLFLLCSGFWTLLLGLMAAALAQTRRVKHLRPLHPAIRGAFMTFFAFPLWFIGIPYIGDWGIFLMLGAVLMGGVGAYQLVLSNTPEPWYKRYLLFVTSFAFLSLLTTLLASRFSWLNVRLGEKLSSVGLLSREEFSPVTQLWVASTLLLPLLLIACLIILSIRNRIPVSAGVVLAMRRVALPATALLAISLALSIFLTAHYDRSLGSELEAMTREGIAYYQRIPAIGTK